MIILGYPGVGKSTFAKQYDYAVDLESSSFTVDGQRHTNWYKVYVDVARHISAQGKVVFISTHYSVLHQVEQVCSSSEWFVMFPDISCKDMWIDRLQKRCLTTRSEKDMRAYEHVSKCYEYDIQTLMCSVEKKNQIIIADPLHYSVRNLLLENHII